MSSTCSLLKNEITFFQNQIQSCCNCQVGPVYYEKYSGQSINWDNVVNAKLNALENIKNDIIPKNCQGCFRLEPYKGEEFPIQFSRMIISHWVHCNCSCIYCARNSFSDGIVTRNSKKSDYYDMLPILKEMYKRNLLSTNNDLFVDFQGGDISVLSEFNDIVQELINHNVYFIRFTTNNIVFQPLISDLLHNRKAELMTSLDCGSADSYKKIKRVDKFHNTVENLRHYMSDTPNANIFIKYITVFGVNDNEKDVNEFLDLMFDIQIPTVSFEIDSRNIMMNPNIKFVIPKHYYKLLNIFENRCKESKTTKLFINPHTVEVMQKGFFGGQI